ncbi:hypothetical protein P872_10380 [Rhodonellum psychrophilum GCM71 = DSM 17998]|uniref:Uncharacterized protein n=1 Tax=Rhodonellum psychrophilum GCM71 = DSM 17998 TaxID=1123057 RepID=U5BZS0_9BACT|nr:hypothetical protein P872_10380 [Rhodonellum psychrophilum GCM71 = DSM 17998]
MGAETPKYAAVAIFTQLPSVFWVNQILIQIHFMLSLSVFLRDFFERLGRFSK